jgi:cytoskeletal protein CcmA (bactofilin family)
MQWKRQGKTTDPRAYTTLIEEGSELEGKFTFSGTVLVNGRLRGEIISNDSLVIGERGVVNASIRAGFVQIAGEVTGNVTAISRLELLDKCRVFGDVDAPVVVIEEGALFEGHCRMGKVRPMDVSPTLARDLSVVVPIKRAEGPR